MTTFSPLSFLAGCVAGAAGTAVGYPLDTLKVRSQTGNSLDVPIRQLYRGCAVPIVASGFNNSVALGVYENTRRWLRHMTGMERDQPTPLSLVGLAGGFAGAVMSLFRCPQERIKVVQQINGGATWPTF